MAIIKKFRIKSFKNIDPLLEIKNISISFEKRKILDNISFKINPGEILGLLGPNGAGKSTTIGILSSLINPSSGEIVVFGKPLSTHRQIIKQQIGIVPQEFNFNVFETSNNIYPNNWFMWSIY